MGRGVWTFAIVMMGLGCGAGSGARTPPPDAGPTPARDAGPTYLCDAGAAYCNGYAEAHQCTVDPRTGGTVWTVSPCATGAACLDGQCVTSCADQCALGATRVVDGGLATCGAFSLLTRSPTTADAGTLHDRGRFYDAWLRQWAMPVGQVTNTLFAAADLKTPVGYEGAQDSAIWTGTYLAAEALRAKTTGSADALAQVAQLVRTIHVMWNVAGAGSPGWLARFVAPPTSPSLVTALFSASDPFSHFDGSFQGAPYDWLGHISRDQYQGVMLGYALAYEALQDEPTRELIREDVVTFVNRLMQPTSLCPTIDGIPCIIPMTVYNVVTTDKEPLAIVISSKGSNNIGTLTGVQEFQPVLFGLIERPSSAIMLASFFEVALEVTENQPAYATRRQPIQTYYETNIQSWLTVASHWTFTKDCGQHYYANNITLEPAYNLARLEQDPTRAGFIRTNILQNALWNGLSSHKNAFFAYIYAANAPTTTGAASAVSMANPQLAMFPQGPRVHTSVNNTFPPDPSCPGNALAAIDVADRAVSDFLWQRHPWLEADPGNALEVYPGVDYLVAYWMARYHQFLADDTPGVCTRWMP